MVLLVMPEPAQFPLLPSLLTRCNTGVFQFGKSVWCVTLRLVVMLLVCNIVPVRTCNKAPGNTPRKVANTVYKTVVDVKIIQDCSNTVRTTCTQHSVQQSHSSAAVANHGTVSVGSAVGAGFLDMLQVL